MFFIAEASESPVEGKPAKMREAQLQLQRKLQQREHIQKQRQLENESPVRTIFEIRNYITHNLKI